jgi:hypothetical protein
MNIENDLSGYINVFMVNNINFLDQNIMVNEENIADATDNEDEISVVETNQVVLEENDETDDEETIIENFDQNQLIEYDEDEETVPYDEEEEFDDDEETIPDVQPRHITDEMKNSYCRFYVQHIYCYLKSWQTPNFDHVCQTEYGGDFERCVIDYMMPFVFDNSSFNNWLFDFAYRFDNSLNYLVQYLQEMEREDLINMLHEAIPPNR